MICLQHFLIVNNKYIIKLISTFLFLMMMLVKWLIIPPLLDDDYEKNLNDDYDADDNESSSICTPAN
jgi:hypothetical protein